MKRLLFGTTTAQGNDTTSATNALVVRNSAGTVLLGITNDGAVRVGTNASATTQTTASITASGSGTNIGLALVPKGAGAITTQIPDGTATGGNVRGQYAVDLQITRGFATQSATGNYSTICGGSSNSTSGEYATASGRQNSATSSNTTSFGYMNFSTGQGSATIGESNTASAYCATGFGYYSNSNLYGQAAFSNGGFIGGTQGSADAQTSSIRLRKQITGTAVNELYLNGTNSRSILNLVNNATAGRIWNAKIQVVAVCTVQGAGTVTAGEVFGGNYAAIIKRIGNTTSLVGTVQNLHTAQTDTNMATAAVTITADDTNESLKIEFTPPTTAAADTVIRVVATVYLTEVGY